MASSRGCVVLTDRRTAAPPHSRSADGRILGMGRQPGALTLSEDDRRVLAVWAADCAERTLSLFEAQAPNDTRPRDAIDGLRAFARGEMRIGTVRALAARAHAAAREIGDPAAVAAARAAGQAASVAHMAAHARGVAYAAKAAGLAAPNDRDRRRPRGPVAAAPRLADRSGCPAAIRDPRLTTLTSGDRWVVRAGGLAARRERGSSRPPLFVIRGGRAAPHRMADGFPREQPGTACRAGAS